MEAGHRRNAEKREKLLSSAWNCKFGIFHLLLVTCTWTAVSHCQAERNMSFTPDHSVQSSNSSHLSGSIHQILLEHQLVIGDHNFTAASSDDWNSIFIWEWLTFRTIFYHIWEEKWTCTSKTKITDWKISSLLCQQFNPLLKGHKDQPFFLVCQRAVGIKLTLIYLQPFQAER